MDLQLDVKRALVTGSSAGIGEAVAKALAAEGAAVAVHGRHEERANGVAEAIREAGGRASVVTGDLSTDEGADRVAEGALDAFGGVDILVNNAGAYPWAEWWSASSEDWLETYNNDVVVSTFRMIRRLVPRMVASGWGRVIQMGSRGATPLSANAAPFYSASKAAQHRMSQSLAVELASTGVTVNVVAPGPVSTDTTRRLFEGEAKEAGRGEGWEKAHQYFLEEYTVGMPVPRMEIPEEVADLTTFLASPRAASISGAVYHVDSGAAITGFKRLPSEVPEPNEELRT